jgi:hypothetical protein
MLWTEFPNELDTKALGLVLSAFRGLPIDRDAAVLAAFNVAGYLYGRGFAQEMPKVFGQVPPTNEDVDAAFAELGSTGGEKVVGAAEPAGSGLAAMLVLEIALKVLQRLLK